MKKSLYAIFLTATVSIFATSQAIARDASDGCGLGWEITQKTSFLATTTRSTTNVFVPPTFGMTSGTLGCSQHSLVQKKDEAAAVYASENYDSLRQEMSEGQGENLVAFASLLGCKEAAYTDFTNVTRSHFPTIIGNDATPLQFFFNVRSEIDSNPALAANCSG